MGSPQASSTESPKELSFEEVLGGPETKEPEKGFVENVVDTVKGAGQELIDDPAQAALAGGSAAAESYGSLKAGELVSHALGRDKGFNQAIARGVGMIPRVGKILRPIVAPALGMAEFAGASALAHEGIKAGEGAVGVGEAIEKAQAANPNISTTAGTAVMGGMAAKSLKGYKNMLANEGLGKTAIQAGGAAVGGAAFPYIDYGIRKGINAVAGEGTVGEIPVPTSEDVMHSARDMAILGGMGYKGGAPKKSEVKEPLGTEPVKTEEMPPEDTPLSEEEDAAVQSAMEGKKVAITALDEASKNAETSDSPAVAEALKEEAAKVADSPVSSTATPPSVEVGVEAESVAEITPAAQSFADKNGIDISQVAPGKNERVTVNDVRKHRAANQPKSKTNETQISQTEPLAESTPGQAIEQLPTEAAGVLPGVPEGQEAQVTVPLSSADAPNPQGVSDATETPVAEQPAASKPELPPGVEQADPSTPEGRATMHIAAAIQNPKNFAFHQAGVLRELQEAQAAKAQEPKASKKKAKVVDPTAPVYDATDTYREFSDGRAESFNLETNEWEPTKKRELPAPETPEVPTPEQLAGEIPEPDNIPEEAMEPEAPKPQGEVTKEARRLAEAEGVDLSQITPNKQGNITKREITTYLKSVPKEQPPVAKQPVPEAPAVEPEVAEVPVVEEPIIEPDNRVPTTNVRVHTSQGNLGLSMADAQRQEQDFFGRVHSKQGVLPPRIKASEGQGTGVTRYTSVGGKTGGGGIDYNDLKTLETLKSLKTGKKALIFKQQVGGESAVYKIDLDSADEASLRDQLKNSGLENTAIETDPATGKTSVLIFSNDGSTETLKAVKQLAYENGTKRPITKYEGTGELIGEDPVALADYLRESLGRLSSGGGDGEPGGPDRLRMANSLWDLASEAGVKLGERPTAYEDPREKASSESEYVVSLEDQLAADAKIPEELDTKYKQLLLKAFDFVDRALGLSAIELEELREKGDYTPNKDEYYLNLLKRVEAGSLVPYVGEDGRVRFRESNKGFGDFSGYYKSKDVLKSIVVGKLRVKLAEALDGTKDKNQTNNSEKAKALLEQGESLDEEIEKIKENPELSPEQTKELQDLDAKRVKLTKQINPWDLSTKNFQAYVKGFLQNAVKSTQRALKKRANKGLGETNVGDLEETGTSKTEGGVTPAEEILDNTGRGQENDSALDDNVRGDVGGTGDKLDPKADASVQVTAAIRFAQDRKMPVEDRLAVLRKLGEWARVGTQGASSEHSLEVLNIGGELGKSSSPLQKQIGFDISRDFSLADILRGKHRDNAGNLLPGDQSKDLTRYKFSENYELLPEENTGKVTEAIAKDFGGNVPSRISVVYDPEGGWTARIGGGKLEVNSALVKPENVSLEIDHEVGHVLWRVPEYHAKFDELWNSLSPESQAEINRVVEELYSNESEDIRFEEKRVRALEQIRTEALKTEQGTSAWNKLVEYIKNFWKELTGATDIDENRAQKLAAEMVEIGRAVAFDLDGDLRYRKVGDRPDFITPEMDREYMDAVSRGDMETARQLFDEAAAKAGFTDDVYHWSKLGVNPKDVNATPPAVYQKLLKRLPISTAAKEAIAGAVKKWGLSQLGREKGLYVSRDKKEWGGYANDNSAALRKLLLDDSSIPSWVIDEIVHDRVAFGELAEQAIEAAEAARRGQTTVRVTPRYGRVTPQDTEIQIRQKALGNLQMAAGHALYQGFNKLKARSIHLKLNPKGLTSYGDEYFRAREDNNSDSVEFQGDHEIFVKNQSRIKLGNLVTYDDQGNVIPLSQRFNPKSNDIRYRKVEKNERFTEKVSEAGPNRNLSEADKLWFNSQQVKQAEAAAQNWINGGGSFEALMDRNVALSIPEVIHAAAIFRSRATETKAGVEAKEKRGEALTAVEIRSKNEALKREKLSNQLLSRIMSEGGQALGHAQDLNRKFGAFNPEHYIKMLIGGTPEELIEGKMNIRKLKQGLEEIKAEAAQITVAATEPYLEQAGITGEKDLTLLRDILADPSTSYRNVKDAIASLMPNANPAKVTALAERIFRTYSAVGTRIGKQRLPQMVSEAYNGEAITPHGDQFLKKLGDFLKIGKYEEDALNNALLESLGLTGYDAEFIKGIRKDIDAMNAMPEGDLRNGAGTEILNKVKKKFYNAVLKDFRNKANRKHIWDMITAAWQAGVLSGPPTASVNLLGSSFSITVESTMEAVGYAIKTGDMKYFADVYSGFLSAVTGGGKGGMPSSAWAEAVSAMSGKGTRYRNSLMQEASALENIDATDLQGAIKHVAKHGNNLKWVGRVMAALDVINMTAADEAKQRMAMRFFLSETKGHDQAEVSRVMEQLFEPTETLSGEFRKQAEADIAKYLPNAVGKEKKNWIDRRTLELARQEREKILPDISEVGRNAAEKFTYNNPAKGMLGKVVGAISQINTALPQGKFVFSFMNTLANIINQMVDYTPYGLLRANNKSYSQTHMTATDAYAPDRFGEGSPEQMAQKARAYIGTSVVMGLAYMAYRGLLDEQEGKEPQFSIHGAGPRDPFLRQQMQETQNWQPNSIKIGGKWLRYVDVPILGSLMGALGTAFDAFRYKKDEQTTSELLGMATMSGITTVLDKNLLQGANNFFQVIRGDSPGQQLSSLKRLAGGVVSGYTNPGMLRWARSTFTPDKDGMVNQLDSTSTTGWLMSMVPASIGYNTPALNTLGEPIKNPWYLATTRRFTNLSAKEPHPIFTPLLKAGLSVLSPSKATSFSVIQPDGSVLQTRMGRHPEVYRRYVELRGELLREMLTPEVIAAYTEAAESNVTEAQAMLNRDVADQARQQAVAQIEEEILSGKLKL